MLTKKLIDERYQIILIQSNSEANAKLPSFSKNLGDFPTCNIKYCPALKLEQMSITGSLLHK